MSLITRSSRKVMTNVITVGVILAVLIILFKSYKDDQTTRTNFQEPAREIKIRHMSSWMVPLNEARVDKAKALSYEGRHWRYLSEALIDLLGFSSECHRSSTDKKADELYSTSVIVLLHSLPSNSGLREMIRETWARSDECEKHGVLPRFVMGRPTSLKEAVLLTEESEKHGDILVGNFTDTVRSSTMKSLLGLRWTIAFCSTVDFVIEATDQIFMRFDKLPKLLRTFQKAGNSEYILGARFIPQRVIHDASNTRYVKKDVLDRKFYPTHCSLRAGIIIPFALAVKHYKHSWTTPSLVPFADALLGLNAEDNGWQVRHSYAFSSNQLERTDACTLSAKFTALSPTNIDYIPAIWEQLHDTSYMKKCDKPDLDIIYDGKVVDNANYFDTVLHSARELSPDMTCANQDVFMIVLLSSHPGSKDSRDAIRETWANKALLQSLLHSVKVFFLIGQPDPGDHPLRLALDEEHEQKRDLLEGNFKDSFKNLTLKHLFGLSWTADHCSNAKYLFKGDDDAFVNLENVLTLLHTMNTKGEWLQELYLGNGGTENRNEHPNHKYHVASEEYSGKVFPQYCVGSGYVLSMDLVIPVLMEALQTPIMSSRDDVFIGILMEKLQVSIIYNDGFYDVKAPSDTCSLRDKSFMVMHVHDSVEKLKQIWTDFVRPGVQC